MSESDLETYREMALALMHARLYKHRHPESPSVVLFAAPVISLRWSADLVKATGLDDVLYLFPYGRPFGSDVPLPAKARERICFVNRPHECAGLLEFLALPGELVVLLVEDKHLDTLLDMGLSGTFRRRRFPAGIFAADELLAGIELP
ncbi:hypothetical protein [Paraburkholderia kururiensis]|uniref:Uncharacterized protein n=1 Tax=Paraburkholderia kururiensis TaxID=984307 RepID=A0ABZ0WV35_9BURK|nr:hypothetical protein [Paraburkholderia kururiensis]WQD81267.1 hypothetical protein U0042_29790 [Paraburkholderia kururiensis]